MASASVKEVRKILIINMGGIGDLLLSFPAVKALREMYAGASIDIMVVERVRELAHDSGMFNDIFLYKKNVLENAWLLFAMRKNRYDLAINMRTIVSLMSSLKIFLFMAIIHPAVCAGRDTDHRGFFFDVKIPETLKGDKHDSEYDMDTVRALGDCVKDKAFWFDIAEESASRVKKILGDYGIKDEDCLVGINAGGLPSHRWPVENYAKVIKTIIDSQRCIFVLTGDARERGYLDMLERPFPGKVINLAGKLNLRELGALMRRCRLFISNDTGPVHIAAILKRPLIAIFGPGYLKRFDPSVISKDAVVLYKPTECAPCDKKECINMKCLASIMPEEVITAALRLLNEG